MAMGFGGMLSLMMALLSGGATDLLDFVGTEAYWKEKKVAVSVEQLLSELKTPEGADVTVEIAALGLGNFAQREAAAKKILAVGPAALPQLQKSVDDPDAEIANRVRGLIQQIQLASKANEVRRLMAIRTLGERKEAGALGALRGLVSSKEMFVADYAARAVAQIEGKPLPVREAKAADMQTDLSLLPANCGIVGQSSLSSNKSVSLDQLLKEIPAQPGENREEMLKSMTATLIQTAEQIGNVRVEGVTIGVAEKVGPQDGFFVMILRGQYDARAVGLLLAKQGQLQPNTIDGVEVYSPEKNLMFSLVSNERAIGMAGVGLEKMPVKELIAAVKENKGALHTNADLAKLIATVDTASRLWAVCKVSDSYREAPVIAPFDTITLVGKQEKDRMNMTMKAAGTDAAKVEGAVNMVNTGLVQARQGAAEMQKAIPALKPIADFLNSMECKAEGKNATMTASMQGDTPAIMLAPLMLFTARHEARPAPAQVAPVVVEEAKPVERK